MLRLRDVVTMDVNTETVSRLDEETLRLFAAKGAREFSDGRVAAINEFNQNGVKVRRVMQLTQDLAGKPFNELRILDLACGEGVYAIEAGLRGAEVLAIDGRMDRMAGGIAAAERAGLNNVRFQQADVRHVDRNRFGEFDVVYFLGILYHLDVPDVFNVLENLREMARAFVVIDTHVALRDAEQVEHRGRRYGGCRKREHGDDDTAAERQKHLLMSLDNTFAFWFTRQDLVRLLADTGFTTVTECHAPLEPGKAADRVTLIAHAGKPAWVHAYPWVNQMTEADLAASVKTYALAGAGGMANKPAGRRSLIRRIVNKAGFDVRRL